LHRALYRLRNRLKRLVNRCKQFRRVAMREEKRAAHDEARWLLGVTRLWFAVI
jgi:transposase